MMLNPQDFVRPVARRVMDRKVYDTMTAVHVASDWNGLARADFRFREWDLFRTPRGNWFRVDSGGPLTDARRWAGDGWTDTIEKVTPITPADALAFLKVHGTPQLIEKYLPNRTDLEIAL